MTGRATVHIVDDDAAIRDALAWLLASRGLATQAWDSGEAILAALPLAEPACIILDVRMTGLSGPEVFARLRAAGCAAPVIFLTGHADVPVAVQALKTGAFDFVEKPFNDNRSSISRWPPLLLAPKPGRCKRRSACWPSVWPP